MEKLFEGTGEISVRKMQVLAKLKFEGRKLKLTYQGSNLSGQLVSSDGC